MSFVVCRFQCFWKFVPPCSNRRAFAFGKRQPRRVASPLTLSAKSTGLCLHAAAVACVAASGVAVARELAFVVAVVEPSGDELACVVRHPAGLFGLVYGQYGAAGCDGLRVAGEEGGIALQVLRVDGGVVVDVGQQVALRLADAAVAGVGEPLVGLDTITEGDVGVVGTEPTTLGSGVVGAVVVDQHYLVLVVWEGVHRYAAEHVVDVFLPIVCAEDDGEHE